MITIVSSRLINNEYCVQEMKVSIKLYHLIWHVGSSICTCTCIYSVYCMLEKRLCVHQRGVFGGVILDIISDLFTDCEII